MARISGVDIPRDKHVCISLTYIYGIGRPTALEICKKAGVESDKRVKELSEDENSGTDFSKYQDKYLEEYKKADIKKDFQYYTLDINFDNKTSAIFIGILDSINNTTIPIVPAIIIKTLKSIADIIFFKVKSTSLHSKDNHKENTTADPNAT